MRRTFLFVALLLVAPFGPAHGSSRASVNTPQVSPDGKPKAVPPNTQSVGVDTPPPSTAELANIEALTDGTTVRITQLEDPPSLELTAPPDMRMRIVEGPGDRPARAQLTGKDGVITIESPAILWSGLAEYLKERSPKGGEAIHSQQLASGFLVISRVTAKRTPEGYRYYATVSRPDLLVECKVHRTYKVTALAQIKKLASICLSLRPAPPEE